MKYLRRTLVAIPAALAVLLFLLYALRGVIIEPRLKSFISSSVESALGLQVEIGDIHGSYLASLELKDVRTVREGESGPVKSLEAEKIRARYSLLSLLSGLEAFLGRLRVDIDGARLGLELSGGGGEEEPDEPEGGPLALPAVLPEVSIRDSSVTLEGSGFGVRAGGVRLFVKEGPGKGTSGIDIGVAEFDLDHPAVREGMVSLGASLLYDGSGITIEGVDVEQEEVVRSGRVELSGLPAVFSAEAQTVLFGRPLDVRCTLEGSRIDADLTAGEIDLGELFSVILLPAVELDGTLSAEAAVRLDTKNLPGLEGSLSIDWKNARYDAFSADLLEGRASAREGVLAVERLKGRSEENVADLSGFSLSLDALFDGEWDLLVDSLSGAFSLHLADLPGLLSQGNLSIPGMKGDAPTHRIDLEGKIGGRTLSFSGGKLEVDGGRVELEPSAISLPGAGEGWGEAALDVDLVADLPDLSVLNELFPLPELSGSLGGVVSLHGSFGALSGMVDVEALSLTVGERSVGDLVLKGEGDGRLLTVHSAELHAAGEAGDVEVLELSLPAKELFAGEWKDLLQELAGRIRVKTSNIPALLAALGQDSPGKDVPAHSLDLQGEAGGGRIAISQGVFESEPGRLTIEKGEVSLPRPGMDWGETVLDLSMRTDVPDLGRAGEIFGFPGLGGVIAGDLTLSGTISALRGSAALEGSALSFRDLPPGDLSLKGSVGRGSVSITSLELTRGQDLLTASGAFDFAGRTFRDVSFGAAISDLSDYLAGPEGLVRGTALEGNVEIGGTLSALEGSVKITADSAEGSASLSGDLQVSPDEGRYSLLMRELSLTREEVGLELNHPATFAWFSPEGFSVKDFSLDGAAGTILIDGTMSPEGDTALVLKISDLTGEGWLEEFAGDRFIFSGADLEVQASGSLERPSLSLSGTVAEFRGRGAPFPLSGELDADYSSEGIEIRTFSWAAPTGKAIDVTGTLPLDPLADEPLLPAEFSLAIRLDIPDLREIAFLLPEGYGVEGKLEGEADLSGTWERPSGEARIRIADLSFPEKLRPAPPGKLSVDCRLEAVSGEFTLREMKIDSPVISAKASGSWTGVPVLIDVARGEGELLQGDVSLEGTLEAPELDWVSRGVDDLRSAAGALKATFSLEGPVGAPEVTLEADFEDLGLRFRGAPPVQEVNGELSLKDGTLSIPGLEGELGGAPFELSGTLAGIGGEELDFDLKLTGDGLLLYRDQGVRVRADADLAARGPLSKLGLSGRVMITDSRYVKNIDLLGSVGGHKAPKVRRGGTLFSFRDPPLRDLVFDIRLGARDPFIVRNQFIRGSVTPSLRLAGTGEEPALEGRVTIDEYRAQLPTGVLRGEQGLVVFREGEPARPWLEVLGEGRMMGYDITMQITGFADEPRIVLSSSPPLPGDEILLMVLAGTPPRSSDTAAAASTGAALSLFLARSFLSRWFGGDPEATDEMLLDRLETQVGRDITEKGDPTIDISLQLREQFLLEGGSLYLTGEKDRYDDSNYGVRFGLDFLNKGEE